MLTYYFLVFSLDRCCEDVCSQPDSLSSQRAWCDAVGTRISLSACSALISCLYLPQAVTSCSDLLTGALHSSWKVSFCYMFAYSFCFSLINYNYRLFHLCLYDISLFWLQSASQMLLPLIELLFPKALYFFYCFLLLSHNLSSIPFLNCF